MNHARNIQKQLISHETLCNFFNFPPTEKTRCILFVRYGLSKTTETFIVLLKFTSEGYQFVYLNSYNINPDLIGSGVMKFKAYYSTTDMQQYEEITETTRNYYFPVRDEYDRMDVLSKGRLFTTVLEYKNLSRFTEPHTYIFELTNLPETTLEKGIKGIWMDLVMLGVIKELLITVYTIESI